MSPAFDGPCMHEALFDDGFLKDTGVSTLDFAKAMIDEGYHPMTMYFPLVVHGAMLIEPTETETKEDLDQFIAALRSWRARQDRRRRAFQAAPRFTPRRRLDETVAARKPVLRWRPESPRPRARRRSRVRLCPSSASGRRCRTTSRPFLAMVRELAVYENEPVSTVEASEADLMRDCFGERANCEVLIGEVDGAIQGFTLFLHNYSTWLGRAGMHVEDLYVREAARGTGLGRKLLAHVARIARQRNCKRLELSVLHWNPARSFYEKLGFRELEEWRPYRLSDEGCADPAAAEADLVQDLARPAFAPEDGRRIVDLGIEGRRAIVCASSKGLGRACAEALAAAGVDLVLNARNRDALDRTAEAIRSAHGVSVTAIAADITTEAGRAALLAACSDADILVTNSGPSGRFAGLVRETG